MRPCQHCGTVFPAPVSEMNRGGGKFCGQACRHAGRARSREVRFWEKVAKTDTCWIWTGARKQLPWCYGILGQNKKGLTPELAHRVSWELHFGPIPEGMKVLHHCDNPPCVRPDHLFRGTLADNSVDMLKKHRHRVHNPTGLTEERVQAMRARYAAGGIAQKSLAAEYGCSLALVGFILARKVWKHC